MPTPQKEHPFDWNAKLVRFFLHNTRIVWLLLIATVVGGVFALANFRREGFPQISPKIILVQTVYPGATAQEVERQVTGLVESAVKDVKGLKQTSSTSAGSFSHVVVTLDESVTLDTAVQDIQAKIQAVRNQLPADAEQPRVQTFSTSGPSFILGVTNASSNLETIRVDAAQVQKELDDVAGIKSVKLLNDASNRIVVRFNPEQMSAAGVTVQTIQLALQGANVNYPLGAIDVDNSTSAVVTLGAFTSLEDITQLLVGVHPTTRRPIILSDVATVERSVEDNHAINRFGYWANGKLLSRPGILLAVEATSTADVIRVKTLMLDHLNEKKNDGQIPSGISVIMLNDQAQSTQDQINEILNGAIGSKSNLFLLGGIQLLFLAMLLFVNWRAALVAAIAIPISLFFTFLTISLLGIHLNTIVLFSLILVLGLIVDPAIVMVESIQRYRDLKYSSNEAILESGRRYGASLFMAVLTSVIVFAPFGVVSGIFGQIIKYIPLTVVPALVASYLVPIGFLPLFTKYLIRTHKPAHQDDGKAHEIAGLPGAAEWFMRLDRAILNRRWKQIVTLVVAVVCVAGSLGIVGAGKVQTVQFSKPNDNPYITISATLASGTTVTDRDTVGASLEHLLTQETGIDHFFYYDQNESSFFLWAQLLERRDRDSENTSKMIVERLRSAVKNITGVSDVIVNEVGIGTPDADYQINTQLYDNDPVVLERAAKDIGAFLAQQPHVIKVDDGFTNRGAPEIRVVLDRVKTQTAGLSSYEVGQQLKVLTEAVKVTKYTGDDGAADVYLVNNATPSSLDSLRALPLLTRAGSVIKVGDIATIETGNAVDAIQRFDGQRYVNVRARVEGNNSDVFAIQRALNEYATPDKLKKLGIDSNESRGDFDEITKSFRELGIALVIAVILTYIVLVIQFKSFSQPMIMLVTVPLSFIGVFPALWATGADLGFLELLGITILVGIVENVAIFLMDYANQLVDEQGVSPRDAIIQAVGVRFRPILLTKLVALGGLLPLAIESEFWRGLAVTIIAGIGLSGFLSLIVIPILYVWIQGRRESFHRRLNTHHQ